MQNTPERSESVEADPLGKVVRICQLMDLYGGLLTEKQQLFVRLHFEEDLSFGEIARQHGVSRQAIHDAAKHAEESLEKYEAQLGLLAKGYTKAAPTAESAEAPVAGESAGQVGTGSPVVRETVAKLRAIVERIRKSGGVIYSGEGLARELAEAAEALEKAEQG